MEILTKFFIILGYLSALAAGWLIIGFISLKIVNALDKNETTGTDNTNLICNEVTDYDYDEFIIGGGVLSLFALIGLIIIIILRPSLR